jgi:hypothetical protein
MRTIRIRIDEETLKFFREKVDDTLPASQLLSMMLELLKEILLVGE